MKEFEVENAQMFFHIYAVPKEEKVAKMAQVFQVWGFDLPESGEGRVDGGPRRGPRAMQRESALPEIGAGEEV